jgi:hypothetical protein
MSAASPAYAGASQSPLATLADLTLDQHLALGAGHGVLIGRAQHLVTLDVAAIGAGPAR